MKVDLGVERDHIESLTRATGISALTELIWNGLDADASEIRVTSKANRMGGFEYLSIWDNGHGLQHEKATAIFGKLGGSEKKENNRSPKGRALHGKEGKGRYKSLALGDLVKFKSVYKQRDSLYTFEMTIDRNHLTYTDISDPQKIENGVSESSFEVEILNVIPKTVQQALADENRIELEERFASYWTSYPNFRVTINGKHLNFDSLIKNTEKVEARKEVSGETYVFVIKIIEWTFDNKKKTYFCGPEGIPFTESSLGIRSSIPISIFIQSLYVERLHRDNQLLVGELDTVLSDIVNECKLP